MTSRRLQIMLGILGALVVALLVHPVCNFVFECGCSAVWSGGAMTCELMPGAVPSSHSCPWCAAHPLAQLGVVAGVWGLALLAGQRFASLFGAWVGVGTVVFLSVFFLFLAAWMTGSFVGYPQSAERPTNASSFCAGSGVND